MEIKNRILYPGHVIIYLHNHETKIAVIISDIPMKYGDDLLQTSAGVFNEGFLIKYKVGEIKSIWSQKNIN